jgi:choline-sulfatase
MRILYIDIDSCRPDHLGCYGYHRDTSPNIDSIAREAVTFKECYTSDAPCLPSRTALYSGRFGIQTGVVGHGGTAAQPKVEGKYRGFRDVFDTQGLARSLQNLGYHTAMISPFGQRHAAHWFYAGFNEIHNTGKGGMESGEEVWPVIDQWLGRHVEPGKGPETDNWFLHINFWDPHTPYRVPAEVGEPFADSPLPAHLDDEELIARHTRMVGPHTALDLGMFKDGDTARFPREAARITDRKSMKHWIDGYDTGIKYVDDYIGRIIASLKRAGLYEETAIIISADHGENQGELGIYGEHGTADAGTCRIPMIVKWPGVKGGRSTDRFIYNVDLAPTLMELLKGDCKPLWDGQSYAGTLLGVGTAEGRDQLVLSQCCHVCQRSVRFNGAGGQRWLYMRTYHDGFHLFPQEMLYDLATDPHEQNDVAGTHPDVCREGAWRLADWHDQQMQKMARTFPTDVADPLWTVMAEGGPMHAIHEKGRSPLPEYLKRLEATGRSEGAAALRKKYGY